MPPHVTSKRLHVMPEGPEIHRAAAKIHRALAGRETVEVSFAFDTHPCIAKPGQTHCSRAWRPRRSSHSTGTSGVASPRCGLIMASWPPATFDSMKRSFVSGGVTRLPEEVAVLKVQGLTRRHWRHDVFSRAGTPCPRCHTTIEKEMWGGRRLYRCPSYQPLRKS